MPGQRCHGVILRPAVEKRSKPTTVGQRLRLAITRWIEQTYHHKRRLGKLTPIEFETLHKAALVACALNNPRVNQTLGSPKQGELTSCPERPRPRGVRVLPGSPPLVTTAYRHLQGVPDVVRGKTFLFEPKMLALGRGVQG